MLVIGEPCQRLPPAGRYLSHARTRSWPCVKTSAPTNVSSPVTPLAANRPPSTHGSTLSTTTTTAGSAAEAGRLAPRSTSSDGSGALPERAGGSPRPGGPSRSARRVEVDGEARPVAPDDVEVDEVGGGTGRAEQ